MIKNIKPFYISFICLFFFFNGLKSQDPVDSTVKTFNYKKDFKTILTNSQDQESDLSYDKLLKRFQDNDSTLTNYETLALMIGYTENPSYKPMEDMEKEVEILDHNNADEFAKAIQKSKAYLQSHPLSLLVLRQMAIACVKISKVYEKDMVFDSAIYFNGLHSYYRSLHEKIMEAMIFSGKGRTPEDPIFALGIADGEYFIPNVGYGIEKKNTLWNKNDDFLEHIVAVDNLTTKDFYFVIQHAKLKIDDDSEVTLDEQNHQLVNGKPKKKKEKSKEKATDVSAPKNKNKVELPLKTNSNDSIQVVSPSKTDTTKNEKQKKGKSKSKEKTVPDSTPKINNSVEQSVQTDSSNSIQVVSAVKTESTKNEKPKKEKSKSKEKAVPSSKPLIIDSTNNTVDKVIQ